MRLLNRCWCQPPAVLLVPPPPVVVPAAGSFNSVIPADGGSDRNPTDHGWPIPTSDNSHDPPDDLRHPANTHNDSGFCTHDINGGDVNVVTSTPSPPSTATKTSDGKWRWDFNWINPDGNGSRGSETAFDFKLYAYKSTIRSIPFSNSTSTFLATVDSASTHTAPNKFKNTLNNIPRTRGLLYQAYLYSGSCYKWSHHNTGTGSKYYTFTIGTPDSVAGFSVTGNSDCTRMDVSWAKPVENGSAITGYNITYSRPGSLPIGITSSPITIVGLLPDTEYEVTIDAENAVGKSNKTTLKARTCKNTPPPACGAPLLYEFAGNTTDNNTSKSGYGDGSLTPRWSIPANTSDATRYQVEVSTDASFGVDSVTAVVETSAIGDDARTLTGRLTARDGLSSLTITNGATYHIRIRAEDTANKCPWSNTRTGTPFTKPAAPNLSVTVTGCVVEATLNLNPPPDNNGSPIFYYRITIGSNTPTILPPPSSGTTLEATHTYTTNSSHTITAEAQNNDGYSHPPATKQADTTNCTGTTICVKPTGFTATSGQDGKIPTSYTIPTNPANYGGGNTTTIRYKAPADTNWTEITTEIPAGATTYTITGAENGNTGNTLTNGTTYTIQARGTASTTCPWSTPATTATPRQPGTPPQPTQTISICTVPPIGNTIPYECPQNIQGTA